MNEKLDNLCSLVYNKIRNKATRIKPITGKELRAEFGLTTRELQKVLFELRKDYPIVARETMPAGYFVAKTTDDLLNYTQLLQSHIKGHKKTLKLMNSHLVNFGDIPSID